MGTFCVECTVQNPFQRKHSVVLRRLLVDTGIEFTWIDRNILREVGIKPEKKDVSFIMANGQEVTRNVGFAILHLGGNFTIDEVVFAQEGDLLLLGARTMEGLNVMIDPARKRLVSAGPLPAASGTTRDR